MSHSPAFRALCLAFVTLMPLFILPAQASPQALAAGSPIGEVNGRTASATTNDTGPSGIIPFTRGFNASIVSTTQHDSSNGWSSILNPNLAYRFNSILSLSASVPIYASTAVVVNTGTKAKPVYTSATKHGVLGDSSLAAHLDTSFTSLDYDGTLSLGLPTGNTAYGLGAGQPTYDYNNHFERSFGIFSPDIELGIGNSSSLIRPRVRKSYTAVGALAHFQAGTSIDLPLNLSLEADAYEELPLNSPTIYTAAKKGKKKVTTATNTGTAEDNGFTASLDFPVSGHVIVSGFYNRSIRNDDDVAGFSLTFLLKAPPPPETVH